MCRDNIFRWPVCTLERRDRPRVGLDLDGILRNIDTQIRKIISTLYPEAKILHPEKWSLYERYTNVPKDIENIIFFEHRKEVFEDSEMYDGANEFVYGLFKIIEEYNSQLVLVTKQSKTARYNTYRWIADKEIPIDTLYIIRSKESKIDARLDILIDDNIQNLEEQYRLFGGAICKARPWNIEYSGYRCESYNEILDETRKILRNIEKCNKKFSELSKAEQEREMYLGLSRIRNERKKITDGNL